MDNPMRDLRKETPIKNSNNIQEELLAFLKTKIKSEYDVLQVSKKRLEDNEIQKSLKEKHQEDLEKEELEKLKKEELENKEDNEDQLEEDISDEEVNQTEEELNKGNDKPYTKSEIVKKIVYERKLEKYYNLKNSLQKRNIKEYGRLAYTDKENYELLLLSKELSKIDMHFKNKYGSHIAEEFEDTNADLNKFVLDDNKKEEIINERHDEVAEQNNKIQDQMDEVANKMSYLDPEDEDYSIKYEYYAKEYATLNMKLHIATPSILDIHKDELQRKKQLDFNREELGTVYEEKLVKSTYSAVNKNLDELNDASLEEKGLINEDDKTTTEQNVDDAIISENEVIENAAVAIAKKLKDGDEKGAEEIYHQIEKLGSDAVDKLDDIIKEAKEEKNKDETYEELKDNADIKKRNDVFGSGAVANIDDLVDSKEDREEELKNKKESKEKGIERNYMDEMLAKRNKPW